MEAGEAESAFRALKELGFVAIAPDWGSALEFVEAYAPEHPQLIGPSVEERSGEVSKAGVVLVGRWRGPLSPLDFLKLRVKAEAREPLLSRLYPLAIRVAEYEGLACHALALEKRLGSAERKS